MKNIIFILLISFVLPNAKIKSLVLPGWGEFSLGNKSKGKIFLYAESLLVISAYSFNSLSNNYRTDYTAFAIQHADVNLSDKDYMFALDVGSSDNIHDFNDVKRRQRSLLMNVDSNGNVIREYGHEIYPEGTNYDWNWNSNSNRETFNTMRIHSINYEKYASFALAGMILNRIISLVDVMLLENSNEDSKVSSIIIPKGYDGMELQLYVKF